MREYKKFRILQHCQMQDSELLLILFIILGCYVYMMMNHDLSLDLDVISSCLDVFSFHSITITFIFLRRIRIECDKESIDIYSIIKAKLFFAFFICGIEAGVIFPYLLHVGYYCYYLFAVYLYSVGFFSLWAVPLIILTNAKMEEKVYIRVFGVVKFAVLCTLFIIVPLFLMLIIVEIMNLHSSMFAAILLGLVGVCSLVAQLFAAKFFVNQYVV